MRHVATLAGRALALWHDDDQEDAEAEAERVREAKGASGRVPLRSAHRGHDWVWRVGLQDGGAWQCAQCLLARAVREDGRCVGAPPRISAALLRSDELGHVLVASRRCEGGQPLWACWKCGCWAERSPQGLAQRCLGRPPARGPQGGGRTALRRLSGQRHPQHGSVRMLPVWRVHGVPTAGMPRAADLSGLERLVLAGDPSCERFEVVIVERRQRSRGLAPPPAPAALARAEAAPRPETSPELCALLRAAGVLEPEEAGDGAPAQDEVALVDDSAAIEAELTRRSRARALALHGAEFSAAQQAEIRAELSATSVRDAAGVQAALSR